VDKSEVKLMVWGRIKAAEMELASAAELLAYERDCETERALSSAIHEIGRATVLISEYLSRKRPA